MNTERTFSETPSVETGAPSLPRISVIVPSFNQGRYLEQTIRSVLDQDYPNTELIVMDGGSTDESPAILERYSSRIAYWQSAPDDGQTDAILNGFARATGELVAFQNSDDFYAPGSFHAVARACSENPGAHAFYGDIIFTDAEGKETHRATGQEPSLPSMLPHPCIYNAALFVRREGMPLPDRSLRHIMDVDWFWKMMLAGRRFARAEGLCAFFRLHEEAKTSRQETILSAEEWDFFRTLLLEEKIPQEHRHLLIEKLRNLVRGDFGRYEFAGCRRKLSEGVRDFGLPFATPELLLKTAASLLGIGTVRFLKGMLKD